MARDSGPFETEFTGKQRSAAQGSRPSGLNDSDTMNLSAADLLPALTNDRRRDEALEHTLGTISSYALLSQAQTNPQQQQTMIEIRSASAGPVYRNGGSAERQTASSPSNASKAELTAGIERERELDARDNQPNGNHMSGQQSALKRHASLSSDSSGGGQVRIA